METEKYLKEQDRIARIAYTMFVDKGFGATSYGEIAKAAGIQKSLLQYYFPKKDIFIANFIQVTFQCVLNETGLNSKSKVSKDFLQNIYFLAYFMFWYLTKWEKVEKLRTDVLSSRDYSKVAIDTVADWVIEVIPGANSSEAFSDKIRELISCLIGGGFEYAYDQLLRNKDIDVAKIVDIAMGVLVMSVKSYGIPVLKTPKFKPVEQERLVELAKIVDTNFFLEEEDNTITDAEDAEQKAMEEFYRQMIAGI